jgi:hypothetical protein
MGNNNEVSLSQPKTKANSCVFCGERLNAPSKCQYCGFRFCDEHKNTDDHQCGKTRHAGYVKKSSPNAVPNLASGTFIVVCECCGYRSAKGSPIEFAGEELIQHTQVVGCSGNIFLEETSSPQFSSKFVEIKAGEQTTLSEQENEKDHIVDQLTKLASLREKGAISDDEFLFIKKEIIKKLK